VLGDIERLKSKEQNGGLTKDEQINLHHAENLLARSQVTNLEAKQKALSKLPTPRDLHSTELAALAKAKAMLARPWPGTAPKPESQATTAATTQSSSGSLPPRDTSTTHGVIPPAGTATSSQAGTGDTTGSTATGSTTSTASSGDTTAPAPGSGTHTTNGVTAPPVGHGNRIPEDTTHPEHIDLAKKRVENLAKIARKRPLDSHEQGIYDNALRVRDRNAPAQPGDRNSPLPPGSRNTSNPDDLAMAGDQDALVPVTPDGEDAHLDAAADAPPPAASAQPANAIGSAINGPSTANPDAPTASAGPPTTPPQSGPAAASQAGGITASSSAIQSSGSTSSSFTSNGTANSASGGDAVATTQNGPQANGKPKSITPPVFNKTHSNSQPVPKGKGLNGGRMQSHHGLQQEWAIHNLSQYGYRPGKAPTITIETGTGLQHTIISNLQNARREARKTAGKGAWSSTLQEELGYIVSDLQTAGYSRNEILRTLNQQYRMLDKLGVPYQPLKY
jgi:hypothetical protein